MQYTNKDREYLARKGISPCKQPYCTGAKCYRNPMFCVAWQIFNEYRKGIGKYGKISKNSK